MRMSSASQASIKNGAGFSRRLFYRAARLAILAPALLLAAPVHGQTSQPTPEVRHPLRGMLHFLRALPEGGAVTAADVRRALPKGIRMEAPHWTEDEDAPHGNLAELKGKGENGDLIYGVVVFLNDEQRAAVERGDELAEDRQRFDEADKVYYVQLYLGDAADAAKRRIRESFVKAVDKYLCGRLGGARLCRSDGPPEQSPERPNFTDVSGLVASWTFRNGRQVALNQYWYGSDWVLRFLL